MGIPKFLKHFDWPLFLIILFLVSVSVVVIYSTTWGEEGASLNKVKMRMLAAGFGFVVIFFCSFLDYRFFKTYYLLLYTIMVALLVGVLLWGVTVRGSRSWFSFGFFQFQPSEIAKIILIVVLATFLAKHHEKVNRLPVILSSSFLALVPVGLIIFEHDLGAAVVLVIIWIGMLIVAGLRLRYILITLLLFVVIAALSWFFLLAPYQKSRIMAFLDPERDPLGQSYNVIQSMIAVGSGGIWGKGLGQGSQSQLKFLPEQHNDFIFAVIAEEFGFLGGVLVLGLFVFLILRILKIARNSQDKFGALFGTGMAILILTQVLINIGMNIGLVPVAGISLPLVSYGGSVLVSFSAGFGILQSIYANYRNALFRRQKV